MSKTEHNTHGIPGVPPALFDLAAARTKCRPSTVNAARMVLVDGATMAHAATAANVHSGKRSVVRAVRTIRTALAQIQQGEARRCPTCGAMLKNTNNTGD